MFKNVYLKNIGNIYSFRHDRPQWYYTEITISLVGVKKTFQINKYDSALEILEHDGDCGWMYIFSISKLDKRYLYDSPNNLYKMMKDIYFNNQYYVTKNVFIS